jgi:aminoglycoside phosphotransferase (APT) family kinase protein
MISDGELLAVLRRNECTFKQFGYGQSNPTFLLTINNSIKLVLRKKPSGKLVPSAHQIEREYEIIKALYSFVPVPRAVLLYESIDILDTPFYIMEYLDGNIHTDILLRNVEKSQRASM